MVARVSHIEAFRRWRLDEESGVEDLIRNITSDEPSEAMQAGTAFHRALELAAFGEHGQLQANGYTFHLEGDGSIELPAIREIRMSKNYGGLTISGQVDGVHGTLIVDHKTTRQIDMERYMLGAQWRFYLDIFQASTFRWHIFEVKEVGPLEYTVSPPHVLTAHRYPEMQDYCRRLADDYHAFALQHLADAA